MNTAASLNNTGIQKGHFYKVPRTGGFELPFGGRWLKATGHYAGSVWFVTASGKFMTLGNAAAELLAKHADATRVTTPKGFL